MLITYQIVVGFEFTSNDFSELQRSLTHTPGCHKQCSGLWLWHMMRKIYCYITQCYLLYQTHHGQVIDHILALKAHVSHKPTKVTTATAQFHDAIKTIDGIASESLICLIVVIATNVPGIGLKLWI